MNPAQQNAIRREWSNAILDGNYELALRIEKANPDLFPRGATEDEKEKGTSA